MEDWKVFPYSSNNVNKCVEKKELKMKNRKKC